MQQITQHRDEDGHLVYGRVLTHTVRWGWEGVSYTRTTYWWTPQRARWAVGRPDVSPATVIGEGK